ncbi:NAD(P)H-dependent oxidoreductase [Pseudorhodoplanes sp.]|uniref:NAD(P)H-dependent oxidoreductase n=1 Tax=Pseudorhodoplanes sp. TaxID=1934341 RepID=UPI003D11B821
MNNPDATALAQPFRIAALCGSLREHSFNRGLIRAAIEEAPEGIHIVDVPGLRDVPPFDVDVMHSAGAPAVVRHFVDAVREADAIIIATDLPPLKWSSLKYDFRTEDKIDGKEETYG